MSWWSNSVGKRRVRKQLFVNQNGRCFWCGRRMTLEKSRCNEDSYATLEHLIPVSQGGLRDREHVVAACLLCNHRRADKPIEVFVEELLG